MNSPNRSSSAVCMKILLDTCHSNKKWVKFLVLNTDLNFCRAGQKARSLKLKLKLQQQKSCQTLSYSLLHGYITLICAEFRSKSFYSFREKLPPEHWIINRLWIKIFLRRSMWSIYDRFNTNNTNWYIRIHGCSSFYVLDT